MPPRPIGGSAPTDDLAGQLAWAGRRAVADGLVVGSGGNLSARRRGADECQLTASGAWLDDLRDGRDFCRVALPDGRVRGDGPPRSSEWAVHVSAYRARPDVAAVLHLHPPTAVLLDALDLPVKLVTTDHAYYVRRIARTSYLPPGGAELAGAVAAALTEADVVLLRRHGCVVVAPTVELAYRRAVNLEQAALATWRAVVLLGATALDDHPVLGADLELDGP